MKDLESFRTWGSLTPGHPEYGHTAGVEMTTGPLGQGVATAVGMAMAARYERGLLDPLAPAQQSIFDHTIWVICSDGDLQINSDCFGCINNFAHCRYCSLLKPDDKMKCPCNKAFVFTKISLVFFSVSICFSISYNFKIYSLLFDL